MFNSQNKVKLKIISRSEALEYPSLLTVSRDALIKEPIMEGDSNTTFLCGECNFAILKKVDASSFNTSALRCPRCNSYNAKEN